MMDSARINAVRAPAPTLLRAVPTDSSDDVPERMQLRAVPVTATELGSEDPELDQEAEWIFKHAFNDKPISQQVSCADPSVQAAGYVSPDCRMQSCPASTRVSRANCPQHSWSVILSHRHANRQDRPTSHSVHFTGRLVDRLPPDSFIINQVTYESLMYR